MRNDVILNILPDDALSEIIALGPGVSSQDAIKPIIPGHIIEEKVVM